MHAVDALLVAVPKGMAAFLLCFAQHASDSVQTYDAPPSAPRFRRRRLPKDRSDRPRTFVEILKRRAKREPHKVVARRVEEVPAVRGVDVEEDAGYHDRPLLEELLEERQAVVERRGEVLEIEPNVERGDRRDGNLEAERLEALEDVVTLMLEVLLQCDLFLQDAVGIE